MNQITTEKIEKYLSITENSLKGVKLTNPKGKEVLDMAQRYFSDAKHYYKKGDLVTAFGSVNFAHGWLDAGVHMGFFKVDKNVKKFFTID